MDGQQLNLWTCSGEELVQFCAKYDNRDLGVVPDRAEIDFEECRARCGLDNFSIDCFGRCKELSKLIVKGCDLNRFSLDTGRTDSISKGDGSDSTKPDWEKLMDKMDNLNENLSKELNDKIGKLCKKLDEKFDSK